MAAQKKSVASNDSAMVAGYRQLCDMTASRIEAGLNLWLNLPATAKWISQSIEMNNGMAEITKSSGNRIYRAVVERLNFPEASEALRNWADIWATSSVSLSGNYANYTQMYLNDIAECLGAMGRSNGVAELTPVYISLISGIKNRTEAWAADVFGTLSSFNSAMDAWVNKSLKAYETHDGE